MDKKDWIIISVIVIVLSLFVAALCYCSGPRPDTFLNVTIPEQISSSRIRVTRIGVIEDPLAYGDKRGLYIITDTKTGKEYVGVSGIGISELGSHTAGKASITDER